MKKKLSLLFSLTVIVSVILTACGGVPATTEPVATEPAATEAPGGIEPSTEEPGATQPPVTVTEFKEAPMLAEMVASGDLPPVEERLPVKEDIMVVTPVDGIGEYGGIWHETTWWQGMGNIEMTVYDPPVRWKADYTGYEPGLVKEWEIAEDGKTLTWHFRQGVKWSDGVDFIPAVDLAYWWELATNEDEGLVSIPFWGRDSDGTPMEVSFPDDYTMVMQWNEPHYIANFVVAQGFWEWLPMERPKHFLSPHDPNYDSTKTYEDLEKVVYGGDWLMNVAGYPCLHAWCPETVESGVKTVLKRNPYYWKVDTEGNQLPYIDYIDTVLIEDSQARLLEVSQGKFEATFRGTDDPTNIPFLLEQADANDYYLHEGAVNGAGGWPAWNINMNFNDCETYPDTCEEIRALLQNQDFRQGLAYALDRERLIDVAWGGIGEPTAFTISPQAWHFASPEGKAVYDEWKETYSQYDPELAAEKFDAAGFVDADGDGFRDLPSGAPFELVMDQGDWGGQVIPVVSNEVYAANLEEVGVNTLINDLIGQPDWTLRHSEGLFMIRNSHASELDVWTFPDWIFPLRGTEARAWPLEGKYYETGGAEGWEPQPDTTFAYELQQLYKQGIAEPDIEKRHQIVYDAIRILIDNGPFIIGGSGDQQMPVVVRNGFHGIPDTVILGPWAPGSPGNLSPEQFWMEESLRND
ncbi:MAG TPA: ABC transporter substrate-binding protein [Anaerolineales bacterium]|jgi:peptide/nickel transport system substrate-binding protein|nr:ABC transporter substrate-binding protein [Anaerolineales bacterium]